MIEKFFTKDITINRNEWTTVEDIEGSELVEIETIKGHLQQANLEDVQNAAENFTLSHMVWVPCGTDIIGGDTLLIDEEYYSVRNVVSYCFVGGNQHIKVLVEKSNETLDAS